VAILVALLSVTNAVLMSVLQRTRQIAIMRALGASQPDVFGLVLAESVTLAVVGGLLGALLAAFITRGVADLLGTLVPVAADDASGLRLGAVAWALGGAALLGALAGFYPGWRAGRIPPAISMRE
jgi:putative ABC transport system permease protein